MDTVSPPGVLVVEQSRLGANVVRKMVGARYQTLGSNCIEHATRIACQEPGLVAVLLEAALPESTEQFLRTLRGHRSMEVNKLPVIITINTDMSNREKMTWLSLGASDFMIRPLDPVLLLAKLSDCANHIRHIKQLGQNRTRLHDCAVLDPVNKLANRQFILQQLDHDLSLSRRYQSSLSFLAIRLADASSRPPESLHSAMVQLKDIISRHKRREDCLGLLSDDQFGLILPQTSPMGARILAHRLCAFAASRLDNKIPVHIGLTGYKPGLDVHPTDLLMEADKLSRKKQDCRNHVLMAKTLHPTTPFSTQEQTDQYTSELIRHFHSLAMDIMRLDNHNRLELLKPLLAQFKEQEKMELIDELLLPSHPGE